MESLGRVPVGAWDPAAATGDVNPGYRVCRLVNGGRPTRHATGFAWVLDAFAPVRTAWLALVPAGGHIACHVDEGPYFERWHVPVVAGTFCGAARVAGVAFRVHHWRPHWVDNPGGVDRVHLVIDRDVPMGVPWQPFRRVEEPDGRARGT